MSVQDDFENEPHSKPKKKPAHSVDGFIFILTYYLIPSSLVSHRVSICVLSRCITINPFSFLLYIRNEEDKQYNYEILIFIFTYVIGIRFKVSSQVFLLEAMYHISSVLIWTQTTAFRRHYGQLITG